MEKEFNLVKSVYESNFEVIKNIMDLYKITLSERDNYLDQIEAQISSKRTLLLEKRKNLEESIKQNQFLEGIKNDYQLYNNYIVKQKQDQIRAMDILNQYIGDIMVSGKLTDKDIQDTKAEQNNILSEMSKIKQELNEAMKM